MTKTEKPEGVHVSIVRPEGIVSPSMSQETLSELTTVSSLVQAHLPRESDSGGYFFNDLKENLEKLKQSVNDGEILSIYYKSQSGQCISVDTISLSQGSDLAILTGVDLLDNDRCTVFCNIQALELIVKVIKKHADQEAKPPLGFQLVDRTPVQQNKS